MIGPPRRRPGLASVYDLTAEDASSWVVCVHKSWPEGADYGDKQGTACKECLEEQ